MPVEIGRTTARKTIKLPSGGTVDIKVITKINFVDPVDRYQETQVTFDNSAQSDRKVHVDNVYATEVNDQGIPTSDPPVQDLSMFLQVERVDKLSVLDPVDRGQETQLEPDNVTGAEEKPPHFSTHFKTHIYRFKNKQSGEWIDSELIDEMQVIDPVERGQETHLILNNPEADDPAGQADPDDPDITDSNNGIDPAWRTDPFQNIVNFSNNPWKVLRFNFSATKLVGGDSFPGTSLQSQDGRGYSFTWMGGFTTSRFPSASSGTITGSDGDTTWTGAPFTPETETFSPNQVCAEIKPFTTFVPEVLAVKASATGTKYMDYPTPGAGEGDWLTTTSATISGYVWEGDGPWTVFVTNPEITNPGMLSFATQDQIASDRDPDNDFHKNLSIFIHGSPFGSFNQDFSALVVTGPGTAGATYLPVAISLYTYFTKDNVPVVGAYGTVDVLCKLV